MHDPVLPSPALQCTAIAPSVRSQASRNLITIVTKISVEPLKFEKWGALFKYLVRGVSAIGEVQVEMSDAVGSELTRVVIRLIQSIIRLTHKLSITLDLNSHLTTRVTFLDLKYGM